MDIKNYLNETKLELTKVTWPNRRKVGMLVVIILIILAFVGTYVFSVDAVLSFVMRFIERIRL